MRTFTFYIEDDRYTVPTLAIVTVKDETRARAHAERLLGQSAHHLSVEVREGDDVLFTIASGVREVCDPRSQLPESRGNRSSTRV